MPGLTAICYAMFICHPWEACSFPKGTREEVNLEEKGGESGNGRSAGSRHCARDVMYRRRILKKSERHDGKKNQYMFDANTLFSQLFFDIGLTESSDTKPVRTYRGMTSALG